VRTLAGLTTAEADALEKAGIATIADVLLTPPASHERYALVHPGTPAPEGNVTVRGRLRYRFQRIAPRRASLGSDPRGTRSDDPRGVVPAATARVGPLEPWTRARARRGRVDDGGRIARSGKRHARAEPVGIDGRGSGFIPLYGIAGVDDSVVRHAAAAALSSTRTT
jgi:hypothetical protein